MTEVGESQERLAHLRSQIDTLAHAILDEFPALMLPAADEAHPDGMSAAEAALEGLRRLYPIAQSVARGDTMTALVAATAAFPKGPDYPAQVGGVPHRAVTAGGVTPPPGLEQAAQAWDAELKRLCTEMVRIGATAGSHGARQAAVTRAMGRFFGMQGRLAAELVRAPRQPPS